MAQPLANLKATTLYAGIVEFGDKIMAGKDVLKFESLSPVRFIYPDFIKYKHYAFEPVAGLPGSEYAFMPMAKINFGTFSMNPNSNPNISSIFPGSNVDYVVAIAKVGQDRYTVSTNSLIQGTRVGGFSGSYARCGVAIKIGDSDYVGVIADEWGDRNYLFTRDNFDGSVLTSVHSQMFTATSSSFSLLYGNNSKVFVFISNSNNRASIYSYDMSSKSASILKQITKGKYHTRLPSEFLPQDKDSNTKKFYAVRVDSQNTLTPEIWTLDTANNSVSQADCSVNWNGFTPTVNVNDSRFGTKSWITQNDNGTFLHCATICRHDYNPSNTKYGIYTFKIDENNPQNLEFVNFTELPGKIYSMLPLSLSKEQLVISTAVDTYTASFNGSEWIIFPLEIGTAKSMLYDRIGRLWISTGDKLYRMTPSVAIKADIWFEPDEITWDGTTKEVKVYVEARNMYGELVAVSGKLVVLYGDLEFENGAKSIDITTSTSGAVEITAYQKGVMESALTFITSEE
jgi:hypothetical protein